jgi:hypothetical protein
MPLNFDPYDTQQLSNLRKAVKYNYLALKPFRTVRRLCIEAARGHYYKCEDDTPTARRDPVNMMDQLQQTLVRSFVQSNPKARVTSRSNPKAGRIFQAHLNETIHEIKLLDTLRRCLQEAILGYMGIAYCGTSPTENDPAGEVFCDPIGLPDFVVDMGREEFHHADLIGHRFSRRIGELIGNDLYDQDMVVKLRPRRSTVSELDDDTDTDDHYDEDEGSLFDWVDIWAIQVRPAGLTVYMSQDAGITQPLRVASIDAPEFGPYVLLGFDRVLDEIMPNSRAAMMLDMHDFVQSQYLRIMMKEDQAADFYTYEGGAEEDARQIRDAQDQETLLVNNNAAVVRRSKPGTNPQALATAIHGRQLFDELSGYIRRLGGVSSTAETATEARIDQANTSRLIRDMQLQVVDFTKRILQNLAWYEWTHPTRTRRVELKVGRNGMAVQELWEPVMREGDFIEHEIDIVPDSMEHRSSGQQLEHLVRAVTGMVIPMMQMPSERPTVLKTPEFFEKYSELDNLPELAEVVDYATDEAFVSRPPVGGGGGSPGSAVPAGVGAGGGQERSVEDALMEGVFRGAVSGGGQQQEE